LMESSMPLLPLATRWPRCRPKRLYPVF